MKCYKLPDSIDINKVRGIVGSEGSRLNPIQDADGNWVIFTEEVHAAEFNNYKIALIDTIIDMEIIDWNPPIIEDKFP